MRIENFHISQDSNSWPQAWKTKSLPTEPQKLAGIYCIETDEFWLFFPVITLFLLLKGFLGDFVEFEHNEGDNAFIKGVFLWFQIKE